MQIRFRQSSCANLENVLVTIRCAKLYFTLYFTHLMFTTFFTFARMKFTACHLKVLSGQIMAHQSLWKRITLAHESPPTMAPLHMKAPQSYLVRTLMIHSNM